MKSAVYDEVVGHPSMKDKSTKDADKTANELSLKSRATKSLGCRKSGKSVQKVSKGRCKTTCSNDGYCLHLPSPPLLLPKSPVIASSTKNAPQEILTPVKVQSSIQIQKFQLQLFPIDEHTRKSLEEDSNCPYLKLTITTKKKIASIIKHLNHKWGNSRSILEELVLFPYSAQVESLESYERWSLKDSITAAEVHDIIGKPAVFRLRYGWLNCLDPKTKNLRKSHSLANQSSSKEVPKKEAVHQKKQHNSGVSRECEPFPTEVFPKQCIPESFPMKSIQPMDNLRSENDAKLSWIDGISNLSFGAIFSEIADDSSTVCRQMPQHLIPNSCDSFDAAIAAHIARYVPGNQSSTRAQPSILDAEETCNPFSFHSSTTSSKYNQHQSVNSSTLTAEPHGVKLYKALSPLSEHAEDDDCIPPNTILSSEDDAQPIGVVDAQLSVDSQGHKQVEKEEMQVVKNGTISVNNQFEGLDMHWPPSVDPWQFVVSASQQMINNDSSCLNGAVSNNMDIF